MKQPFSRPQNLAYPSSFTLFRPFAAALFLTTAWLLSLGNVMAADEVAADDGAPQIMTTNVTVVNVTNITTVTAITTNTAFHAMTNTATASTIDTLVNTVIEWKTNVTVVTNVYIVRGQGAVPPRLLAAIPNQGLEILSAKASAIGEALDDVEWNLAEWGHASVSGFFLVPDRSGFFNLQYSNSVSYYADKIRSSTQGQASFLDQRQFSGQLTAQAANALAGINVQGPPALLSAGQTAAQANLDHMNALQQQIKLEQLKHELARIQSLSNSPDGWQTNQFSVTENNTPITNPPTGPTNLAPQLPGVPSNQVPSVITNPFSPPGKLGVTTGNSLTEEQILKMAATVSEEERVLNFMSHPIDIPGNKKVYFAIGQISVTPGWRSRKDYFCEVTAMLKYSGLPVDLKNKVDQASSDTSSQGKNDQRKMMLQNAANNLDRVANSSSKNERIYSDSTDAQNNNLPNSIGISIISAFPFTDAQTLDLQNSYRSQLDLLLSLAGTYTQLGYKVDASLLLKYARQIQKDLSTRNAFPTVIPSIDKNAITYRFDPEVTAMADPAATSPKASNLLLPVSIPVIVLVECDRDDVEIWPELSFEIETRWVPKTDRSFWANTASAFMYNRIHDKRFNPSDNLRIAGQLDITRQLLDVMERSGSKASDTYQESWRRYESLRNLTLGRSVALRLPRMAPVATEVNPTNFPTDFKDFIAVKGDNLGPDTKIWLFSKDQAPVYAAASEDSTTHLLVAKISDTVSPGTYSVIVKNDYGSDMLPQAIVVPEPPSTPAPPIADGRKDIVIIKPNPTHGFKNATTTFLLTGENFNPPDKHDKVTAVYVAGRAATNVVVISDQLLRFDVPAWVSKPTDPVAFLDSTTAADVTVASALKATTKEKILYFELISPVADNSGGGGGAGAGDAALDKGVKVLKALAADGSNVPHLTGALRLEVGADAKDTNSAAGGSGSTVIIQTGSSQTANAPGH